MEIISSFVPGEEEIAYGCFSLNYLLIQKRSLEACSYLDSTFACCKGQCCAATRKFPSHHFVILMHNSSRLNVPGVPRVLTYIHRDTNPEDVIRA